MFRYLPGPILSPNQQYEAERHFKIKYLDLRAARCAIWSGNRAIGVLNQQVERVNPYGLLKFD